MAKKTVMKDIPLIELNLRRYERPSELDQRSIIRKACLSLGLLQPGDSRDIIVDILAVLIKSGKNSEYLDCRQIEEKLIAQRKSENLPLLGIAPSNIRRHLRRLKELLIVETRLNKYRLTEFSSLDEIFTNKIERFILPSIIERIKEYLRKID